MKHKKVILILGILISIFFLLQWPTTTRQGVNWEVSELKIPLYFKTLQFFSRHYEMKYYTRQILQNETDDLAKIKKLYSWMQLHIHPTPQGFDVIDDHPLHIFIRRYGTGDQMADLFSLMCTYAGLNASYRDFKTDRKHYSLAFVKYQNSWQAFDLYHHVAFIKKETQPYDSILKDFNPEQSFRARNLQQMPWPRLKLFLGLKP
ncbi:MAG: transglutaminase domain-containing protein [Deltaproteobacteria bacterium]|nr:transglutaminase domain-containing protein [Deltaproteobacteria bacterium]